MPRFTEFTQENLAAVDNEDLIQITLSISQDNQQFTEMDKTIHWHLRNSVLILSGAVVLLSSLLIWFMVSNFKLRRIVKINESN